MVQLKLFANKGLSWWRPPSIPNQKTWLSQASRVGIRGVAKDAWFQVELTGFGQFRFRNRRPNRWLDWIMLSLSCYFGWPVKCERTENESSRSWISQHRNLDERMILGDCHQDTWSPCRGEEARQIFAMDWARGNFNWEILYIGPCRKVDIENKQVLQEVDMDTGC